MCINTYKYRLNRTWNDLDVFYIHFDSDYMNTIDIPPKNSN